MEEEAKSHINPSSSRNSLDNYKIVLASSNPKPIMEEEAKFTNHNSSRNGLSNLEPIPEEEAKSDVVNYSSQNEGNKRKLSVRLSRWFVGHQKIDGWNQNSINALHAGLVGFLVVAYICHIAGGPIFQSYTIKTLLSGSKFIFVCCIHIFSENISRER